MKLTTAQLYIINLVLQIDEEGKAKQYGLSDLTIASDIFKELKKCVKEEKFVDSEVKLSSEQKVFLIKAIDERKWAVGDAENIFGLKDLLK